MLKDVLTENLIDLNVRAETWQEAIAAAGTLLVKASIVKQEYVQAMIETVEKLGPYVVIAPGIAVPHARPEDGALKSGISLVRLSAPVVFGHSTNDPVKLVIALAAVDDSSHIKALAQLTSLLDDEHALSVLRETSSREEVMELIKRYSAE